MVDFWVSFTYYQRIQLLNNIMATKQRDEL